MTIVRVLIVALVVTKVTVFVVDEVRLGLPERLRELDHVADELIDEVVRDRRERREGVERAVAHGRALHRVRVGVVEVVRRARRVRDAVTAVTAVAGDVVRGVRAVVRRTPAAMAGRYHDPLLRSQSIPEGNTECWKA